MSKKQPPFLFTVEGNREFPFDMLRYDQCHPLHESDSGQLAYRDGTPRQVRLMSMTKLPTKARWKSFGWKVLD